MPSCECALLEPVVPILARALLFRRGCDSPVPLNARSTSAASAEGFPGAVTTSGTETACATANAVSKPLVGVLAAVDEP